MNEFERCPTEGAIGLLALLIKTGRLAETRLDDALAEAGLTFVKWRALDTLVKAKEPIALKLLPGELNCVKSNVTQLVDKLAHEKLVRRVSDAQDRRSVLVELTKDGLVAHTSGREALEAATLKFFSACDHDQTETLRDLLKRVGPE